MAKKKLPRQNDKTSRRQTPPKPAPTDPTRKVATVKYRPAWKLRQGFRKASCELHGHGEIREVEGVGRFCLKCGEWMDVVVKSDNA